MPRAPDLGRKAWGPCNQKPLCAWDLGSKQNLEYFVCLFIRQYVRSGQETISGIFNLIRLIYFSLKHVCLVNYIL